MIHPTSPGTTSVPLRPSGGTCLSGPFFSESEGPACQVRFFGGTCLSRPLINVRRSIAFRRGLKSRAESGAKAPHSIWSAAIHRRFLVKALAFTVLALIRMEPASASRRDPLVGSDEHRLMTHPTSSGTTSVPLRPFGGTCLSGPFFSESEGPACQVRFFGATCLSRPLINVRRSIAFRRGLKSRAKSGALWSAAIHRRFFTKASAFARLAFFGSTCILTKLAYIGVYVSLGMPGGI